MAYATKSLMPVAPLVKAMNAELAARGYSDNIVTGRRLDGLHHGADEIDPTLMRAYRRARRSGGITVVQADRICCTILGTHPSLLWPREYWTTPIVDTSSPTQFKKRGSTPTCASAT